MIIIFVKAPVMC